MSPKSAILDSRFWVYEFFPLHLETIHIIWPDSVLNERLLDNGKRSFIGTEINVEFYVHQKHFTASVLL